MGAAYFYHLTQNPLEYTLPILLEKARSAGWKIAVRGTEMARLEFLDQKLWLGREESFLPHGIAGGDHDALQPILLTTAADLPNNASCIMCVDGAEISAEDVKASDRVCILFDGYDEDAVARARVQWKALTDAGCGAQYWSEEDGGWQKKAEKTES